MLVGGQAVTEPGTDLAVAVAIASSYHEAPVAVDMAFMGELGDAPPGPTLIKIDEQEEDCVPQP